MPNPSASRVSDLQQDLFEGTDKTAEEIKFFANVILRFHGKALQLSALVAARNKARGLTGTGQLDLDSYQDAVIEILAGRCRDLPDLIRPLMDAFELWEKTLGIQKAHDLLECLIGSKQGHHNSGEGVDSNPFRQVRILIGYIAGVCFNIRRNAFKKARNRQQIIASNDVKVLVFGSAQGAHRIARPDRYHRQILVREEPTEARALAMTMLDRASVAEVNRIAPQGPQAAEFFRLTCYYYLCQGMPLDSILKTLREKCGFTFGCSRMTIYRMLAAIKARLGTPGVSPA